MTPPTAEPLHPSAKELPARAGGLASYPPVERWNDWEEYDATAQTLVRQFVENFAQFEKHVDEGVRQAALVAA